MKCYKESESISNNNTSLPHPKFSKNKIIEEIKGNFLRKKTPKQFGKIPIEKNISFTTSSTPNNFNSNIKKKRQNVGNNTYNRIIYKKDRYPSQRCFKLNNIAENNLITCNKNCHITNININVNNCNSNKEIQPSSTTSRFKEIPINFFQDYIIGTANDFNNKNKNLKQKIFVKKQVKGNTIRKSLSYIKKNENKDKINDKNKVIYKQNKIIQNKKSTEKTNLLKKINKFKYLNFAQTQNYEINSNNKLKNYYIKEKYKTRDFTQMLNTNTNNSNNSINLNLSEMSSIENDNNENNNNEYYGKIQETKTAFKELNLEDFILIIQKFETIRDDYLSLYSDNLASGTCNAQKIFIETIYSSRIKIYDLYKFYMGCSFDGLPEKLYVSKISKYAMHISSIIFIISLGVIYIISHKIKITQDCLEQIIQLINIQEKIFLFFCDSIAKKLNPKYTDNIWLNQILNILNDKLFLNTDDDNHIQQIKNLAIDAYDIINELMLAVYINGKKKNASFKTQEKFLYDNFYNKDYKHLTQIQIYDLKELFDENIFNTINIRSSTININIFPDNNYIPKIKGINIISYDIAIPIENTIIPTNVKIPYLNFKCNKEYTLVIDLDETMVNFKFTDLNKGLGKIFLRPGLENFLEVISEFYEIIVFTSGTKDYADIILDIIENKKNKKYFSGRLYREHIIKVGNQSTKDLTKLGRNLAKTIIVDNLSQCFKLQKENGILISSFYGENENDNALIELQKILIKIYYEKNDVRKSIEKYKKEIFEKVSENSIIV